MQQELSRLSSHTNRKVYVTYNMLTEVRLKVKGSHVHGKTGNVSQTE